MFIRQIWGKFTSFFFWNLPCFTREVSKFQKMNELNFPQISFLNMWLLVQIVTRNIYYIQGFGFHTDLPV